MNHYLIDYENVGVDGMNGIEQLDTDSRIYIFYTKNADKLTFDLHIKLIQTKAEVLLFKVESGQKNALDFQMSSYLGWLIHENFDGQNNYFIVSKDNGFTSLFPFWKKQGVKISFVADVAQNKAKSASEDLTPIVAGYINDTKNAPAVANIIASYKTKQGINGALVKAFGSQRAGEIYKAVKPLLSDKKGS